MAGVDTSSYPTAATMAAQQAANNPLTMLSTLAGLRSKALENQLVSRTMAGNQAAGQAVQAATGPDGIVDTNAAGLAIAHDPNAAYTAPQNLADLQAQRQAQVSEHTAKVNLALQQNGFMTQSLGALADKPNVTPKDVSSLAGTLVANGILDPKMAANELTQMPSDPTQLPAYLRTLQMRSMQSAQQIAEYHNMTMANLGATQQTVNTAPLADPATLTNTLSPEAAASPVAGPVDASGAPTTTPLGQRAGMGTVATGLGPSAQAARGQYGAQTGQQVAQFEGASRESKNMNAALANMTGDLSQLPTTGPGSDRRNGIMAAFNGFLGTNFGADKIASQEGFNKMAAQVVARQRQMMGLSGTDQQLSMIEHASPGSQLSKLGNKNQIAVIKGNNDALAAQGQAWQTYKSNGKGPESFNQFTTAWNKHVDPLAFQYQYMNTDQKKALVSAMSKDEKDQFAQSLTFARANKLIP